MWLAQKRGLHVDAVFFDTPPFTGPGVRDKVKDLARVLARSSPDALQLTIISLAAFHKVLVAEAPERWWTLLLRRFMLRIADQVVPPKIQYDALVTGDSLGQVASQTIQNLGCLEGVTARPVLRPLVGFDKIEISELAERVGTLAIAARPEADCCTLLAPRAPVVQGRRAEVEAIEATLPLAELERAALTDFEESDLAARYPAIAPSWRRAWTEVIPFLDYPPEVRRLIYTTNAVEALNSKIRRAVRTRGHFPSDEAAAKLIYLALNATSQEWKRSVREWHAVKSQLAIMFEDRFPMA